MNKYLFFKIFDYLTFNQRNKFSMVSKKIFKILKEYETILDETYYISSEDAPIGYIHRLSNLFTVIKNILKKWEIESGIKNNLIGYIITKRNKIIFCIEELSIPFRNEISVVKIENLEKKLI